MASQPTFARCLPSVAGARTSHRTILGSQPGPSMDRACRRTGEGDEQELRAVTRECLAPQNASIPPDSSCHPRESAVSYRCLLLSYGNWIPGELQTDACVSAHPYPAPSPGTNPAFSQAAWVWIQTLVTSLSCFSGGQEHQETLHICFLFDCGMPHALKKMQADCFTLQWEVGTACTAPGFIAQWVMHALSIIWHPKIYPEVGKNTLCSFSSPWS